MTNTDEAERLFARPQPAQTISEYEREQQRIRANMERLKAERLAREAANGNFSKQRGRQLSGLKKNPKLFLSRRKKAKAQSLNLRGP